MSEYSITFHNPKKTWRITWTLGAFTCVVYQLFDLSFYDFYLYFYVVGVISYINSFYPWGRIDDTNFSFYYGNIFKRKSISVTWDMINQLHFRKESKKVRGGVEFGLATEVSKSVFSIQLKGPLPKAEIAKINKSINKYRKNNVQYRYNEESNDFMIYHSPEEGFLSVLYYADNYSNIEKEKLGSFNPMSEKRKKLKIDLIIVFINMGPIVLLYNTALNPNF